MKIYDISQEVFSCNVYPGDPDLLPVDRVFTEDARNVAVEQLFAVPCVDLPQREVAQGGFLERLRLFRQTAAPVL